MSKPLLALFISLNLILGTLPTHFTAATSSDGTAASPTAASISGTLDPPGTQTTDSPDTPDSSSPDSAEVSPYDLLAKYLHIGSVNPGFKIADVTETGEAIELLNSAEISLPLDSVSLRYLNEKNTPYPVYAFADGSTMIGRTILLRYEKSPEVKTALAKSETYTEIADAVYSKTLALGGTLELVYAADTEDEKVIDRVCWTGKADCYAKFTNASPGSLVYNSETKAFDFLADYTPTFAGGLYLPPAEDPPAEEETEPESTDPAIPIAAQCQDLEFNEILSYYEDSAAEQFIELYNPTDEIIPLSGCQLRYKKKLYDIVVTNSATENSTPTSIAPGEFYVYRTSAFTLTKNPNTNNVIELVDVTGEIVAELTYPHGQKKGTAYALIAGAWQTTYLPTPGSMNLFQEFKTCPLGKVINEATGNCVKVSATTNSTTPCPAGKYRNPATGRCKNIESSSSQAECKEGYERNPETNRCRKIKTNDGADYALVPITGDPEGSSFVAVWALVAVAVLGLIYVIFQFRREIAYFFRRLLAKLKH